MKNSEIDKILRLKDVKHPGKLILIYINNNAEVNGDYRLGLPIIVCEVGIAITTVRQELLSLIKTGILARRKENNNSIYRINFANFGGGNN